MSKMSTAQQAWDEVCKLSGQIIELRARVAALERYQVALPVSVCPRCRGCGEIEIGGGNGVTTVVMPIACPTCGGAGVVR